MTEYIVDFGDEKSSAFVRLAMAQAEANGACLREDIVRCKNCRYCMSYWKANYCDYFKYSIEHLNGFCAWGERRKDERA